jgi:pimeloyl-ACP methyl ester carboxylesterase
MHKLLRAAVVATLALTVVAVAPSTTAAQDDGGFPPMIFVHGGLGSGQQFEAQALRFASNGYPDDHIELFEHNSLAYPDSQVEVWDRLDREIADLLAATGAEQVNLLGHSQGTGLVQGYLDSDPGRADLVAQYVNLDGGSGGTVPAEVETLAVWGEGDQSREIPGATNVYFADQGHTEVVNSPETFVEIHRFFTGEEPTFDEVVREPAEDIVVSGRAQLFPQNTGATDALLEIHEVDPETGHRLGTTPEASFELTGDGSWGPFDADGEAFYEFALVRDTGTHHVYPQRFVRSNRWVRILTSEPDGLADSFWERSDAHANMVILRNKEFWGDQGEASDTLTINGDEVLDEATSPRTNRTIGVFVHDDGVDGRSDLSEPVAPFGVNFLTGIDLFMAATSPPEATIGVVTTARLGDGPESVCVPNWASSTDRISIQLASYHHLRAPDGSPAPGHADPTCAAPASAPAPTTPAPAAPVAGAPSYTG